MTCLETIARIYNLSLGTDEVKVCRGAASAQHFTFKVPVMWRTSWYRSISLQTVTFHSKENNDGGDKAS